MIRRLDRSLISAMPARSPRGRRSTRAGAAAIRVVLAAGLTAAAGVARAAGIAGQPGQGGFVPNAGLPKRSGSFAVDGLAAPVSIELDRFDVPRIEAASIEDAAAGLGFMHAQERFFQMDLLRRVAAGELSTLVGPAALGLDERNRIHDLRRVAARAIADFSIEQLRALEAYAEGVNAGLDALSARPFEYLLLRRSPEPWTLEDSVLAIYAMYFDLQDEVARRDQGLGELSEALPAPAFRFLAAEGTPWDAPLQGGPLSLPPMPTAAEYDLRELDPSLFPPEGVSFDDAGALTIGSNNWAVAGALTEHGGALLANDMHLGHRVPNIWFRLQIIYPHPEREGEEVVVTGVSLPAVPGIVVGSNGYIAWGFTNSYADYSDRVLLQLDPEDPERYLTPDGYREFEHRVAVLEAAGAEPREVVYRDTIWGPVVGEDRLGRLQAVSWVAHRPEATNLELVGLELAEDVDAALTVADITGIPGQNLMVTDRDGRIAWTVMGQVPSRAGYDPDLPADWSRAGVGWTGWVRGAQRPRVVDPPDHRLWTANARVVVGADLTLLGDSGYALGARAGQIRDGLLARGLHDEHSFLQIQLDDRALFYQRWHGLLLETLKAAPENPVRSDMIGALEAWSGRASPEDVGFRLVRGFRSTVHERALAAYTAAMRGLDPEYREPPMRQFEGPLWEMIEREPVHLLDPRYPDWETFLLDAADDLAAELIAREGSLDAASWGARNSAAIRHPLSGAVPFLSRWLDAPADPLPGSAHMPRVQTPGYGASERMVVAPGHEERGMLHMPGGQSGHPLSPFYLSGHDAWVRGEPTPLLPGPVAHRLILNPEAP